MSESWSELCKDVKKIKLRIVVFGYIFIFCVIFLGLLKVIKPQTSIESTKIPERLALDSIEVVWLDDTTKQILKVPDNFDSLFIYPDNRVIYYGARNMKQSEAQLVRTF